MRAAHAQRLETWLGRDTVEAISLAMRDWHGPPIAIANTPGRVLAHRGGDFSGPLLAGQFASAADFWWERLKRAERRWLTRQRRQVNTGFSSLSDLISEATSGGKRREFQFQKVGTTGVAGVSNSLWRVGNQPAAAANASNAPGGDAPTDATTGAFVFDNPAGGDTQHFVSGFPSASIAGNTLLLYDRLFQVNKTMSSTVAEAVTGVPTRYQSTTTGADDYAGGNFLFVEVGAALGATAHNWTTCQYTDQDGNTGVSLPSLAGNASAIVNRLDHPAQQFFAPLASGDTGVKALTQMQCSASVTGTINFVIGHALAWLPCPIANLQCVADGINSAFNLARIFDDACLAFLEVMKPSTSATTYTGSFTAVRG